ncbi:MAG: DUF5615 family PIN-like protein [Flavobacteriales bacterium]|nr:MAG: DUF5615 family PIN-like protein [Flavobacteriales bacterium]
MHFLANENFPAPGIALLRSAGYDLTSIRETAPGVSDHVVIAMARTESRVILTFDKDYGEIIFKEGIENPPAVVFFRHRGKDPLAAATLLLDLLAQGTAILGRFTVIEEGGLRQRTY